MSPEAVNLAFAVGFNRQATQDEINQWEGKEPEVVLQTIYNNNQEFRARADQYDAVVKQLNASGVTSADQDKLIAAITAAIKQFLGTN